MSDPIGMLRFLEKNGLVRGVEASMVLDIQDLRADAAEPMPADGRTPASQINLKNGGFYISTESPKGLMDQYDTLVKGQEADY